jgi:glycine/D-amino acid oxidase-like deaminating enzyme
VSKQLRVVIIGGGITGLATAYMASEEQWNEKCTVSDMRNNAALLAWLLAS